MGIVSWTDLPDVGYRYKLRVAYHPPWDENNSLTATFSGFFIIPI
jgi:hypothetical protein